MGHGRRFGDSHAPPRFVPAIVGLDGAVDPTLARRATGGPCSAARIGADWPNRFRTQMIEME